MTRNSHYKDFYAVQEAIKEARASSISYSKIASLYGVSPAWVWNVEHGTFPKRADIRMAFGVRPLAITAEMFHGMEVCAHDDCNELFISNHPKRMYCFKCSPYRGKEAK
jgi:transcriptional regulator with XRE-family HTH domain